MDIKERKGPDRVAVRTRGTYIPHSRNGPKSQYNNTWSVHSHYTTQSLSALRWVGTSPPPANDMAVAKHQ